MKNILFGIFTFALSFHVSILSAQVEQENTNEIKDSLYITTVEKKSGKPKVLHA